MTKNFGSNDVKILIINVKKQRLQQAQSTLKKRLSSNFKKHRYHRFHFKFDFIKHVIHMIAIYIDMKWANLIIIDCEHILSFLWQKNNKHMKITELKTIAV